MCELCLQAGTEEGCVVIFDVSNGGLEFQRSLNRQEGQIVIFK